jgi:hypothetical protein
MDDALLVFARDPRSGALQQLSGGRGCIVRRHRDGCRDGGRGFNPGAIVLTPDGKTLLATIQPTCGDDRCSYAGGIWTYAVRPRAGLVRRRGPAHCASGWNNTGCTVIAGLGVPFALAPSPDGHRLYAASDQGVVRLDGDGRSAFGASRCLSSTVARCARLHGVHTPNGVAVSHDGRTVFVGSTYRNGALAILADEPAPGDFRQLPGQTGCRSRRPRTGCGRARISTNPTQVALSRNQQWLYVGGWNELSAFAVHAGG